MMDRKPVRNMKSSIPKFEKLAHLIGLIIRISLKSLRQTAVTLKNQARDLYCSINGISVKHHEQKLKDQYNP